MKDGLYKYLDVFVGVGFSKELASTDLFSKDYDEGGIFIYTKEQKATIRRTKFNGKKGEMEFMQIEGCGLIFEKKKKRQG